mmetsp:Transcript_21173/g.34485  ORF Transcript_21173/g.34485 Transcript_21173/m.34485 type:complete len:389 (-) Transcript_21173:20-1186(-)
MAGVRFKVGVIDIDDVQQVFKPDVNIFFYYKLEGDKWIDKSNLRGGVRFENLLEKPLWVPNFDFSNEVEEPLITDESFWYDSKLDLVFGRINVIPTIQERFDHHKFPFDRQVLDIQLMSNNTELFAWKKARGEYPVELSLKRPEWLVQCELSSMADAWDLFDIQTQISNDPDALSSAVHFLIFLERSSAFYIWNIAFVHFLIISAQTCMFVFPFDESRFDFSMQLALTTVAFKFVTTTLVPKTAYLTSLDSYMLAGLLLLSFRFCGDTLMQVHFDLPTDSGSGYKAACENIKEEFTICEMDWYLTGFLTVAWTAISIVYMLFGGRLLRPDWELVNAESRHNEYEVKGTNYIRIQSQKLTYYDMENSSNLAFSNQALRTQQEDYGSFQN